jgi:hypothetical protein
VGRRHRPPRERRRPGVEPAPRGWHGPYRPAGAPGGRLALTRGHRAGSCRRRPPPAGDCGSGTAPAPGRSATRRWRRPGHQRPGGPGSDGWWPRRGRRSGRGRRGRSPGVKVHVPTGRQRGCQLSSLHPSDLVGTTLARHEDRPDTKPPSTTTSSSTSLPGQGLGPFTEGSKTCLPSLWAAGRAPSLRPSRTRRQGTSELFVSFNLRQVANSPDFRLFGLWLCICAETNEGRMAPCAIDRSAEGGRMHYRRPASREATG